MIKKDTLILGRTIFPKPRAIASLFHLRPTSHGCADPPRLFRGAPDAEEKADLMFGACFHEIHRRMPALQKALANSKKVGPKPRQLHPPTQIFALA